MNFQGVAAELTTQAATIVAVAGGTGAFLGAIGGQIVQWIREGRSEKRAVVREIEKERRDHQRESYIQLIQNLKAMQVAALQIHIELLRISVRRGSQQAVDENLEGWRKAAKTIDAVYRECQKQSAAYVSKSLSEYLDFFQQLHACFSVPNMEEDDPFVSYTYAVSAYDGVQLITAVTDDFSTTRKNLSKCLTMIREYLQWGIDTARYEMRIDSDPPGRLPYRMKITQKSFHAGDS